MAEPYVACDRCKRMFPPAALQTCGPGGRWSYCERCLEEAERKPAPQATEQRNLPKLLREAERRVNAHVFRTGGDDSLASIPANLAARCTLQIQSSIFGEKRVICLICSKVNQLGRKTGKFDPMGAFQGVPAVSAGEKHAD